MSRKLLGKVMAGAGLGAASLLICAPGTALADDAPPRHESNKGYIHTEPKGVKPGHRFKVILRCTHPVERPWVTSKITGKLWLKPVAEDNVRVPEAPRPPENGDQPDDGAQPSLPPNGQQPSLPPNGEQPALPPGGGQPPVQPEGAQPAVPGGAQPDAEDPQAGADEQEAGGEGGQAAYRYEKYWAWAKVSHKIRPGHYPAWGSCHSKGHIVVLPRGAVPGGDGGVSTDSGQAVAGAGLLGAAAVGGFLMIRRRRTDGSLA